MTNRRSFIIGAGAALVTLPLGNEVAKLLSAESLSKDRPRPAMPVDSHVLIVVPTMAEAVEIQQRMGNPRNVKVIGTGAMLCGYGADYIITDDDCKAMTRYGFMYDDWYNSSVRTRLMLRGSHVQSSFDVKTFDWGNSHGLEMRFVDLDQNTILRQAVKVPKRYISFEDRVEAKALLYEWWLRKRGINV